VLHSARCSGARRLRDPPPNSVLEERARPSQPDPPEILTLIPDFWNNDDDRNQEVIALTHVCRAWREVFTSRTSLWTDFNCENKDQAHLYFERSKSLPVNLSLYARDRLPPYHPFFEIIPRAIGRLGSLSIGVMPGDLQAITAHLSRPAPLLEKLSICGDSDYGSHRNPVLMPALFNGDLSSLRKLRLECVRTELPWRNMVNLTHSSCVTRHGAKSPSDCFLTSLKVFLASAKLVSTT
jgi:hypothetical protein